MNFPHRTIFFLLALLSIGVAASLVPIAGNAQNTSPQRLRISVEHRKLEAGKETKVVVEFLDMNYNPVANDTKREIVIGQLSAGSSKTGGGDIKPDRLWIGPGEKAGYATFVSHHSGRVFITAESKGLESARTLVLITEQSASLLSRLFETVAYAEEEPFAISPDEDTASANNSDPATFQISFIKDVPAGTTLKISTSVNKGKIVYRGEVRGSSAAEIKLDTVTSVTDDIQIFSTTPGEGYVYVNVDGLFSAQAKVRFDRPRPSKILFDDVPKVIPSDASQVCVMARLYDESTILVKADQDRTIHFRAAKDSDKVSFEPESVRILEGQNFAETRLKLTNLPSGNRISIIASSDPGIQSAEKSIPIQSFVQKLLVTGPREVKRGQEVEFTVQLAKQDGAHCEADLDRTIDLSIDGGTLAKTQLIIPKGQRQGSIKYRAPTETGSYTLTAFSSDIEKHSFPVTVVYPAYLLILLSLFGSFVGGVARQVQDKSCKRIAPSLFYRQWDVGLPGWLVGSLVGGLFFYWAFKLGFGGAVSSATMPATLDLGSKTTAFFFGGIGGFAGTVVLDLLASWFMPLLKREQGNKQPAAPAV
ncbi:MAG TPA: hypothetical protein VFP64_13510 [Pyrinomonadaceae bacterium]|nr:hypothetical protein [Pyrinomonadaceae bacterium]